MKSNQEGYAYRLIKRLFPVIKRYTITTMYARPKRKFFPFLLFLILIALYLFTVYFKPSPTQALITPPTGFASTPCGVRKVSDTTVSNLAKPKNAAVNVVNGASETPNFSILQFRIFYGATSADDRIYTMSNVNSDTVKFRIYNINDPATPIKIFTLAISKHVSYFALDPEGNVYVSGETNKIFKFKTDGTLVWKVTAGGVVDRGIYSYAAGPNDFRIAANVRGLNGSNTFSSLNGAQLSDNKVVG